MIRVTDEGVEICGYHVYPLALRLGIGVPMALGISIFVVYSILTYGLPRIGIVAIIPPYLLMEHVILKREDIWIPYAQLRGFASNARKKLIALEFDGHKGCSPAVLRSNSWDTLLTVLQKNAPHCNANLLSQTPQKQKKSAWGNYSLWIGLSSLIAYPTVIVPILAIIFGIKALLIGRKLESNEYTAKAIIGIILGVFLTIMALVFWLVIFPNISSKD
jgi:hypothetical protein